jgi:hypothetical protein
MLYEKKIPRVGHSTFADSFMILYMTVNLVKLLENNVGYEDDPMTKEILDITLDELFKSTLIMNNGIWN